MMQQLDAGDFTVLVVEDEAVVRFVSVCMLEDAGFHVVEAATASEALEILRANAAIGVLFTDVNMPGDMDGLALAALVHANWPDIRLVVTSGQAVVSRSDLPEHGRFIAKPFSGEQLVGLMEAVTHTG